MIEVVRIKNRFLSPTAVNTYLSCPRKFYYRYIQKLKTKPSIHLIRGQIVHQVLHRFHKNHPRIAPATEIAAIRQELLTTFNQLWDRAEGRLKALNMTQEQLEFYHDDSELMLFNFSHWFYKRQMPCPDLTEARLYSQTLRLMGIVDAIHETPDKVILVDYKTSKNPVITDDMKRQAAIYALLYQDKFNVIPDAVWIHFLVDPADPSPIHVDEHLLAYGKILVDSVREKTASENIGDYPCTCGGYCEKDLI